MTCQKIVFPSRGAAKAFARAIQRQSRYPGAARPYVCPFCGEWHLTSKEQYKKRTQRKAAV